MPSFIIDHLGPMIRTLYSRTSSPSIHWNIAGVAGLSGRSGTMAQDPGVEVCLDILVEYQTILGREELRWRRDPRYQMCI